MIGRGFPSKRGDAKINGETTGLHADVDDENQPSRKLLSATTMDHLSHLKSTCVVIKRLEWRLVSFILFEHIFAHDVPWMILSTLPMSETLPRGPLRTSDLDKDESFLTTWDFKYSLLMDFKEKSNLEKIVRGDKEAIPLKDHLGLATKKIQV